MEQNNNEDRNDDVESEERIVISSPRASVISRRESVVDNTDEKSPSRNLCEELTSSEAVDKTTALNIMKLYHAMETERLRIEVTKDRAIEALRNELAIVKLTHKHAEAIEQLCADGVRIKGQIAKLTSDINASQGTIQQMHAQMGSFKKK